MLEIENDTGRGKGELTQAVDYVISTLGKYGQKYVYRDNKIKKKISILHGSFKYLILLGRVDY